MEPASPLALLLSDIAARWASYLIVAVISAGLAMLGTLMFGRGYKKKASRMQKKIKELEKDIKKIKSDSGKKAENFVNSVERSTTVTPESGRTILEKSPSDLSDLLDKCSNLTDYHADKVKEPYLKKWLKISGDVVNVEKREKSSIRRESILVQCDYPMLGASESVTVYMEFDAGMWEIRLADLKRGDQITALGKIGSLEEHWIILKNCELA